MYTVAIKVPLVGVVKCLPWGFGDGWGPKWYPWIHPPGKFVVNLLLMILSMVAFEHSQYAYATRPRGTGFCFPPHTWGRGHNMLPI